MTIWIASWGKRSPMNQKQKQLRFDNSVAHRTCWMLYRLTQWREDKGSAGRKPLPSAFSTALSLSLSLWCHAQDDPPHVNFMNLQWEFYCQTVIISKHALATKRIALLQNWYNISQYEAGIWLDKLYHWHYVQIVQIQGMNLKCCTTLTSFHSITIQCSTSMLS